nr:MAG TPA: hypothetical protein [Caudoviricetes sp.]
MNFFTKTLLIYISEDFTILALTSLIVRVRTTPSSLI